MSILSSPIESIVLPFLELFSKNILVLRDLTFQLLRKLSFCIIISSSDSCHRFICCSVLQISCQRTLYHWQFRVLIQISAWINIWIYSPILSNLSRQQNLSHTPAVEKVESFLFEQMNDFLAQILIFMQGNYHRKELRFTGLSIVQEVFDQAKLVHFQSCLS